MKHEKISLKWKIFAYLLALTAVILVVLWLLQTVYLESMYKHIKERDLSEAVSQLEESVNDADAGEQIAQIAEENELCLAIVNRQGDVLYWEQFIPVSPIANLTAEQFQMYYEEVKSEGGSIEFSSNDEWKKNKDMEMDSDISDGNDREYLDKVIDGKILPDRKEIQPQPPDSGEGANIMPPVSEGAVDKSFDMRRGEKERPIEEHLLQYMRGGQESMVNAKILDVQGEECLMLATVKLTPVEATVNTLRVQLVYISAIVVVLALLLAFLISRTVSKSIIKVNASAQELAKGNFDVNFDGRDYKEIGELSDTLNFAAIELAKSENLQRELLANVSHDLRTPLTMIIAYAEVMRDLPGENTPENVQVVIEEAQRLTNLVNDMLDISKLQAGVLQMEKRIYDLTESIEGVMERFGKLKEQEQYQIQFLYQEHVTVCADEFKIFQVMYNLINNAINYTGEDKKVTVEQIVQNGMVRMEVRDTGMGIPGEELNNVWERYYKVDKVHKRAIQGTGLGLSICKNILKAHQARFGVDSELGRGSTFWFELEAVDEQ